jgi:hypothetical protein
MKRARSIHGFGPLLLLAGAALAALPSPAAANWLLTREGARLETRGPWEVKGNLVVFRTVEGTLSSLRLAEVDLRASERATAEAQQAPEEGSARLAERRRSLRSITDRDVGHARPRAAEAGAAEGTAKAAPAEGAAGRGKNDPTVNRGRRSTVAVGAWQKIDHDDGIELAGELKNAAAEIAADVRLTVALLDETGGTVGTAEAVLTANAIGPEGAIRWSALFPGVFTFASAKFDVRSAPFRLQAVEKPANR